MARKPREESGEMRDVAGEENSFLGSDNGGGYGERVSQDEIDERNAAANGATPLNDATTEAKKPKKTPDEKRADFNRLASGRVSRAIDALSSLLHLANTSTYEWTDEARVKIFSALRDKIDTVEASFVAAKAPTDGKRKSSKQLSFRVDL
jgi:hypothetical protein